MKRYQSADRTYYFDDENRYHRDNDLPAIEWYDGSKEWFQHGKFHRLTGPAGIYTSSVPGDKGYSLWYLNGKRIFVYSQEEFERYLKLKAFI